MLKNKKGQEEIVGFVAVVILVVVVGVILLSISLNHNQPNTVQNGDLTDFIDSSYLYTSDCAFGYEPNYASVKDLIDSCYTEQGKQCLDGREVCFALNQTIRSILDSNINVGPESSKKGYNFDAIYSVNATTSNSSDIISILGGNCSSANYQQGESFFSSGQGVITTVLKVCS